MTSKIEDIEEMLVKIRAVPEAHFASMNPRRVYVYPLGVLEYPRWLSEHWLEDGHWAGISSKTTSMPEFIRELEAVADELRKKEDFMKFCGASAP